MKGIILAGGTGSRLHPITQGVSKQLIPIYDKPMIYYPLSTLMSAGIREILLITTPRDLPHFQNLLGDGSQLGCTFTYKAQETPRGLADAFIVGEEFIGDGSVAMILGDNIFYGSQIDNMLSTIAEPNGGVIFGAHVTDPERYGIIEFDTQNKVLAIEEKPRSPKSNYAIPGLYFFDNEVVSIAKQITPSSRGEIEITDVQRAYLAQDKLSVILLDRGTAWLDTGTFESMNQAAQFVRVVEERQGIKIGCIEETAFQQGFIDKNQLQILAKKLIKSGYGEYLERLLEEA